MLEVEGFVDALTSALLDSETTRRFVWIKQVPHSARGHVGVRAAYQFGDASARRLPL
jgi:hypothetical protein